MAGQKVITRQKIDYRTRCR